MNFVDREFEIAKKNGEWDTIYEFIPEIKNLILKFKNSGQSGGSSTYVAKSLSYIIENLCLNKPICSITDDDSDWTYVGGFYQNKRCSALFKVEGKRAYYLDAIVFMGIDGMAFTSSKVFLSNGTSISSKQYVKFPFIPKTFYIDVYHKGNTSYVKDESQLDAVFDYYYNIMTDRDNKINDIIS